LGPKNPYSLSLDKGFTDLLPQFIFFSAYGAMHLNKIVSCLIFSKLSVIRKVTVTVSPTSPPFKKKVMPRPRIWVVGYFDCSGDFASSSALSARRSGSASIRNTTDYCGHRPAHASKRMPPSMISTRPGQFAFSPNPAPGLRGSRVIGSAGFIAASRGTAEDFRRLASLSRARQIG
jgi:hypothetical protein